MYYRSDVPHLYCRRDCPNCTFGRIHPVVSTVGGMCPNCAIRGTCPNFPIGRDVPQLYCRAEVPNSGMCSIYCMRDVI